MPTLNPIVQGEDKQVVVIGPNGARTTVQTGVRENDPDGMSEYDRLMLGLIPGREGYKDADKIDYSGIQESDYSTGDVVTGDYVGDYGGEDASTPDDQRESLQGAGGTDYDKKNYSGFSDSGSEEDTSSDESASESASEGDDSGLRQLPSGAMIVKVGNEFRAVLELSDGLGAIWYDITDTQYTNLESPTPSETYNEESFEDKYGNFYFGNINEIEVNGDTAWSQMTKSIFAEFGKYIPLETPELKRLVMQAYLEGWDQDQVTAEYKTTPYYQNMTNQARAWLDMSGAEQAAEVERTQYKLLAHHIYEYGEAPKEGIGVFKDKATQVAKGDIGLEGSYYSITTEAEALEGSSANRRLNDLTKAKNAEVGAKDGWYSRILNAHNTYSGNHMSIDEAHYTELAKQLSSEETDWNTVLNGIQMGSAATHTGKDPILTWNQYSSGAKSSIKSGLELANINNDDSLLTNVLSNGLTGKDLDLAIRNDERYLNTKKAEGELSGNLTQLGKSLGFTT